MAGHSKFKNIMYRKGAQDKKRSMNSRSWSAATVPSAIR
jgi:transcriptional/translational regulatory protein YebC/TACO1